VVAALQTHHPSDPADGTTLGRQRRPRRPVMRVPCPAQLQTHHTPEWTTILDNSTKFPLTLFKIKPKLCQTTRKEVALCQFPPKISSLV
jgi:hypothetical protein